MSTVLGGPNQVVSKEPCPVCLLQKGIPTNTLKTRPGSPTECAGGHKFEDTEELRMLQAQARQRFPNIYTAIAPAPAVPTDPSALANAEIVITADMKKLFEEASGVKLTGASDVKGLIYAITQDNKDKDSEIKSLKATVAMLSKKRGGAPAGATAGPEPGQVVITIPEWALAGVTAQAEYSGKTPEEWVSDECNGYFENYFGGVQPHT